MYKGTRFNHINHMNGYFKNWSEYMTDQAILGTLLDQEDRRIDTVSEVENYIRSIRSGK